MAASIKRQAKNATHTSTTSGGGLQTRHRRRADEDGSLIGHRHFIGAVSLVYPLTDTSAVTVGAGRIWRKALRAKALSAPLSERLIRGRAAPVSGGRRLRHRHR